MQIELTPSEVAVLSGVLMAQMHPMLVALRENQINQIVYDVLDKLEHALMAESN
jgi:hypothetical protein